MKPITVGIVDYGLGNHASVKHSLRDIGFRVRVSDQVEVLDNVDVLVLPGVGAFPSAMQALHERDLVVYLKQQAHLQRPIVGICLGMELLVSASHEFRYTAGLDIIPGEFVPIKQSSWHIGWNTLECLNDDPLLMAGDGLAFYFNHSFVYQGPPDYQACVTRLAGPIVAVIRRANVIGLQFHPEKSQLAGKRLLDSIISGLIDA